MLSVRAEGGISVADDKEEKLQNGKFINEAISSLASLYLLPKMIEIKKRLEGQLLPQKKNIGLGMLQHQTAEQDSAHGNERKILLLVKLRLREKQ